MEIRAYLYLYLIEYVHLYLKFWRKGVFDPSPELELQSGNAQLGLKSAIYCPLWPWNVMDDLEKQ